MVNVCLLFKNFKFSSIIVKRLYHQTVVYRTFPSLPLRRIHSKWHKLSIGKTIMKWLVSGILMQSARWHDKAFNFAFAWSAGAACKTGTIESCLLQFEFIYYVLFKIGRLGIAVSLFPNNKSGNDFDLNEFQTQTSDYADHHG